MSFFCGFTLIALLAASRACGEHFVSSLALLDLGSDSGHVAWLMRNRNNSMMLPAVVPGGVYTDLMRNGVIGDILTGNNDVLTRWVAYDQWTYTAYFYVTSEQLSQLTANLVLNGLDTVGYVELNDHPVARTDNMFIRYVFSVKEFLKVGLNILKIIFDSPVVIAKARSYKNFVAPNCVPEIYNGECHANQIRKMQASFSWDWGPAFPSVGIWKPVYIQFYNTAVIRSVTTHFTKKDGKWEVKLNVYLEADVTTSSIIEGHLEVRLQVDSKANKTVANEVRVTTDYHGTAKVELLFEVSENEVSLWWPNGYGDQPLYSLRVMFTGQGQDSSDESSYKDIQIGFRTVELVEDEASMKFGNTTAGEGLTFYFKVNGYPLFMKGSNWIPGHILPELGSNETMINYLLSAARESHMTMLRVWGGGVFESDYFYKRCDELGILVWQDFMFACAMYPVGRDLLRSVSKEVEQNVQRLQHHPSIAVWAGNNENEAALRGNWYNTKSEFDRYKQQYITLYVNTIKPIVAEIDPGRKYLVSSPSNGRESENEGYISKNPYSSNYGDTHYYNYLANGWSMSIYPQTRFASEYGFQSFPSIATLKTATNGSEDLDLNSAFTVHRQHSPGGNMAIKTLIDFNMRLDQSDPNYFKKFVFASQISQAMSIKAETEWYRQSRADWYTMGALYWQLNDVWQAPSWSSIEFGGRWKMLQYFAKKFFAPVLVSPRLLPSGDIQVYLINEKFVPLENIHIIVDTFAWNNQTPVDSKSYNASIGALKTEKQDIVISALEIDRAGTFIRFSLESSGGKILSPRNYVFPAPLKSITGLKEPNIEISVQKSNKQQIFSVHVKTDAIILFLWLEAEGVDGHFTDNGRVITEPVTLFQFVSQSIHDAKELEAAITYQHYT